MNVGETERDREKHEKDTEHTQKLILRTRERRCMDIRQIMRITAARQMFRNEIHDSK